MDEDATPLVSALPGPCANSFCLRALFEPLDLAAHSFLAKVFDQTEPKTRNA